MKCELCQINEATVHVKQVCEGAVKELSVCADCVAKKGLSGGSALSLANLLFGTGAEAAPAVREQSRKCRGCGLRLSDFKKGARMGCPQCYAVFADDLPPILSGMHPGRRHVGKVPAVEQANREVTELQAALAKAVANQDFEEAARLRDRIGTLKKAFGKGAAHAG